jgi:Trp operon repressor
MQNQLSKEELLEVIRTAAKDEKLLDAFLKDLLTPTEYREIICRWQIVKKLTAGLNQRDVAFDLKTGVSTVTRGARMLNNQAGGFNQILDKLGIRPKGE